MPIDLMDSEVVFRIIVVAFLVLGFGTRIYSHRKAGTLRESIEQQREGPVLIVAGLLMVIWFLGMGFFLLSPQLISWSKLHLPEWVRWTGVALSVLGAPFYIWTHQALGRSFSGVLYVQEDHLLVQEGPYRWIRHPMYTAYIAGHLGYFLMTDNWLIGSAGLLTITLIMAFRVPREEAALSEKFGDAYAEYAMRTGKFLPRFGQARTGSK